MCVVLSVTWWLMHVRSDVSAMWCGRLKRPETVALKIIKNIDKYREAAKLEINVLNKVNSLDPYNNKYVTMCSSHHVFMLTYIEFCYGGRNLLLGLWRCFLTCHRAASGGGESVSRLGLLVGNRWNRWMSRLWDQIVPTVPECANCSLHATVRVALSETVATVSLSTVPRLSRQSCRLQVGKRMRGECVQCGWLDWLAVRSCN